MPEGRIDLVRDQRTQVQHQQLVQHTQASSRTSKPPQIIRAIGAWAAQSPHMQPGKPMSAASVVLSLRALFSPALADGESLGLNQVLDGLPHAAAVQGGALEIDAGRIDRADVTVAGDPDLLAGVVYTGLPSRDAEQAVLWVQGSRDALRRFAGLFPLPDKAAAMA